jgi:hypothetical protein
MLQYPSIPSFTNTRHQDYVNKPCIAFYKYDGSNLRWEWSPKQGWNKFGTRKQLFDGSTPLYNQAIPLFMDSLADELVYRVKQLHPKIERITAFTEFFGPSSLAGQHVLDEQKQLKLFDVFLFKRGLIKPAQFIDMFGTMSSTASVIYQGDCSHQFINNVVNSRYPIDEGVICKGEDFTIKIKTKAYFDKLKMKYGAEWVKYID